MRRLTRLRREREDRLATQLDRHNVVIVSYEVLRHDLDVFLARQPFLYCVLDEGHVIKNPDAKLTLAVKALRADHRLILSGTPIQVRQCLNAVERRARASTDPQPLFRPQNNVTDLWSLFDFLMPGFLGTKRHFNERYGRPILASRDPKCTARDQEAGVHALEALHRQVLPFLLRRMKEEVLHDLPPKIIQDFYCSLSPMQVRSTWRAAYKRKGPLTASGRALARVCAASATSTTTLDDGKLGSPMPPPMRPVHSYVTRVYNTPRLGCGVR